MIDIIGNSISCTLLSTLTVLYTLKPLMLLAYSLSFKSSLGNHTYRNNKTHNDKKGYFSTLFYLYQIHSNATLMILAR